MLHSAAMKTILPSRAFSLKKYFFKAMLGVSLLLLNLSAMSSETEIEIDANVLKAAFLHNFLNFVVWPHTTEQLSVCVLGENPFANVLDEVITEVNKLSPQSKITTTYSQRVQGLETCHIVYISDSEKHRQGAILDYLQPHPVLTVSSLPGFAQRGGDIEFVTVQKRVRFNINNTAMKQKNLKASANLLHVAAEVF